MKSSNGIDSWYSFSLNAGSTFILIVRMIPVDPIPESVELNKPESSDGEQVTTDPSARRTLRARTFSQMTGKVIPLP